MGPAVEFLGAMLFAGAADAGVGAAAAAAAVAAAGGWLFRPVDFAATHHGQAAGLAVPTYLPGTGPPEMVHVAAEQGTLGMMAVGPDMPFVRRLGGAAGVRVEEGAEGVAQAAGSGAAGAAGATAVNLMRSSDAETEIVDAARNTRVRREDQEGQSPSQT